MATQEVRYPWQTPFSSDSVFNLPLGSGAQWTYNAQLAGGQPFVNTTASGWNANLYEGVASDPIVTVTVNGAAGGPTGTYQVHIPVGAVPAGGTDHMLAIDDTSSHTWYAFGGFNFTGSNTATASQGSAEPDYDDGLGGNSQNSNWDNEVGVITEHDLASGVIDHMLNVALPTTMLHSYSNTSTDVLAPNAWPQSSEDGFALSGNGGPAYSGTVNYGVTMGIPAGTAEPADIAADPGANMLWTALQDHGGMVRNSGGGGNEIVLTATQDVDPNDPLLQSIDGSLGAEVFSHVQILANQSPNSVNGGGTPIVALDPPLNDAPAGTSTPTPTQTPSPTAVEIFPGDGKSFTDGQGNVYTLAADGSAMENGNYMAGGGGTAAMEYYNATVYGEDATSKQWYTWNGTYWSSAAAPPQPTAAPTDLYVATTGSDTAGDGSQAHPFATIAAAAAHAVSGDTVHVAAGTYAGDVTTKASGVTYVSDTPGTAKLVGDDSTGFVWQNSGDNVSISGFDVSGQSDRLGIYMSGSSDVAKGNTVHDILTNAAAYAAAQSSGNGGAGIEVDGYAGATGGSVLANTVFDVGPSGQVSSLLGGIYVAEQSASVENNLIYATAGTGIETWHGAGSDAIVNNTVDQAADGGIYVGSGDSGSSATTGDHMTVENNIITGSKFGIVEGGTTGTHNSYVDNLVYGDGAAPISLQNGLAASGTVTGDPLYLNAAGHDYHLTPDSPAIGAGTSQGAPATDIAGTARGSSVDIGAYQSAPPVVIPNDEQQATVTQSNVAVIASGGDHMVFIKGSHDVVSLSGGSDTVNDSGLSNTYVLPQASNGFETFATDVIGAGDTLDLRSLLSATMWDGAASDLSNFLHVANTPDGAFIGVSSDGNPAQMQAVALLQTQTSPLTMDTLLAHAVTH